MMSGRVRMMMGMRRRVWMRMMLHLTRPGGCRWALVVLRRHLASGARAPGGVTAAPAAHAAEVTRRRAARHRTSAPCNKREPGTVSELLRISRPLLSSPRRRHTASRCYTCSCIRLNGTSVANCINSARERYCAIMHLVAATRWERVSRR